VFFKIEHSVTEDHLRHVLFWQAENLTLAWANYEMYNNIRAVYESLIERLSRKVCTTARLMEHSRNNPLLIS
jgi:hypothetical protein